MPNKPSYYCEKIQLVGTAPGSGSMENNTVFVAMPGVPYEQYYTSKSPKLQKMFTKGVLHHHNIKTINH